jgi:fructokinase
MKKTVVAFGEILWDLLPSGPKLGGAPFNFAYRVNSLGDRGIIISRLGRDDLGRQAGEQASALGMETTFVQWDEKAPTGTVQITLDENRNPDYLIVANVAYDNVEVTQALLDFAPGAHCLCFGTLMQRTPTARRTLEQLMEASEKALKLLDINLRKNCYSTETIAWSLEKANVLKLNDQEAGYLADQFAIPDESIATVCEELIARFSLDCCVVTLGERGAFAASSDNERTYVPGYEVEVVDACGAGDAFAAGFIYNRLRGRTLKECCDLGNAMGALVAAQPGATMPIATSEIQEFLRSDHARISEPRLEPFL